MELLLTFDNNYTQHAGVTITSFLANNPGRHTIYVISDYISKENQAKLSAICHEKGSSVIFQFIDVEIAKKFPVGKGTVNPDLTIATYFRLFAAEALPQTVGKVLYLDCDIVVDGSLEGLWNTEILDGKCIVGLEEMAILSIDGCRRLNYPENYSYINAGVLLMDLQNMRSVYSLDTAIQFIQNHRDIKYHDQDVLNGLFYDKKQFMDLQYNVMDSFLVRRIEFPQRYAKQRSAIFNPKIIHFSGLIKPWHKESRNPYTYKYYEYLELTPWKEYKPLNKFCSQKSKAIYFLKQCAKWMLDTLHIKNYCYISLPQNTTKDD